MQPSAFERVRVRCCRSVPDSSQVSPGASSILGKAWIILAMPYEASISPKSSSSPAVSVFPYFGILKEIYLLPRHSRGPPLKGRYPHFMSASSGPSHLSGRNDPASDPYRSLRRCMWYTEYATGIPSRTKIGERPSGPPPKGKVVACLQKRVLIGTGGYSRSARFSF